MTPPTPGTPTSSITVNTFMATANWGAIPDKLDFRLSYTMSLSNRRSADQSGQRRAAGTGIRRRGWNGGQFPRRQGSNGRGWKRRRSIPSTRIPYAFLGIHGQAYAKLRYVWERNSVNNYDQDVMQAYMDPLINNTGFMTWMSYNNPNYNVHLIGASLGVQVVGADRCASWIQAAAPY